MNYDKFNDAEEAVFWFISANEAKAEGARVVANNGKYRRPCEPVDILKVMDRLYRNRKLTREHLLVIRHYGVRRLPPDPTRPREHRAHQLWTEAMDRIQGALEVKGVVHEKEKRGW